MATCKITDAPMNSFCAQLGDADRAKLCDCCVRRDLPRGQMLFKEDIQKSIFVVLEGCLESISSFVPRDYLEGMRPGYALLTQGHVFSCDLVCNPQNEAESYDYYVAHSNAACKTLAPTKLAGWPLGTVKSLFAESPSFARSLFTRNIEAFGSTCEFAAGLRLSNAEDRIKFILCFTKARDVELTHQQIADVTGLNRTTVSRTIASILRNDDEFMSTLASIEPSSIV